MTFSYSPDTDRGKVRLLLHDTTTGTYGTDYDFSDADIDSLLEQNSDNVWLAAADGCRVMASKLIASSFSWNIAGAISIDKSRQAETWKSLAIEYTNRATGSSENVVEFIDSYAQGTDMFGQDTSEYVGDD